MCGLTKLQTCLVSEGNVSEKHPSNAIVVRDFGEAELHVHSGGSAEGGIDLGLFKDMQQGMLQQLHATPRITIGRLVAGLRSPQAGSFLRAAYDRQCGTAAAAEFSHDVSDYVKSLLGQFELLCGSDKKPIKSLLRNLRILRDNASLSVVALILGTGRWAVRNYECVGNLEIICKITADFPKGRAPVSILLQCPGTSSKQQSDPDRA